MSIRATRQCCYSVVTIAMLALVIGQAGAAAALKADKAAKPDRPTAKRAARLPAYYASVIDEKQRAKIQTIHDQYGPQIQQKRDELQKLNYYRLKPVGWRRS